MHGARQRQAVADDVGTVRRDRHDVSGVHFGPAAAIDRPQAGDGAAGATGARDGLAKLARADGTIGRLRDMLPWNLGRERSRRIMATRTGPFRSRRGRISSWRAGIRRGLAPFSRWDVRP